MAVPWVVGNVPRWGALDGHGHALDSRKHAYNSCGNALKAAHMLWIWLPCMAPPWRVLGGVV